MAADISKTPKTNFGKKINAINLTTYADDLVITISPKYSDQINLTAWQSEVSQKVINWLKQQLSMARLELKESKTRIITADEPVNFCGSEIPRGKGIRLNGKMVKN